MMLQRAIRKNKLDDESLDEESKKKIEQLARTFDDGEELEFVSKDGQIKRPKIETASDFNVWEDEIEAPPPKSRSAKLQGIEAIIEEMKQKQHSSHKDSLGDPPSGSHPPATNIDESCNLYFASLAANVTEELLQQKCNPYGTIKSCKIMYPRPQTTVVRGINSGFVEFETRQQAEAAREALDGQSWFGVYIRVGWGKSQSVSAMSLPVGNQIGFDKLPVQSMNERFPTIRVRPPDDEILRAIVDNVSYYVVQEGYPFEQHLMVKVKNKDPNFPNMDWLLDPQCRTHVYYRWRVYSLAQGDSIDAWREEPFQMCSSGPLWSPPSTGRYNKLKGQYFGQNYVFEADKYEDWCYDLDTFLTLHRSQLCLGYVIQPVDADVNVCRNLYNEEQWRFLEDWKIEKTPTVELTRADKKKLEKSLRRLTIKREDIANLTVWCMDNVSYGGDIAKTIVESCLISETPLYTKLARLYAIHDILSNCATGKQGTILYRSIFESALPLIMCHLNKLLAALSPEDGYVMRSRIAGLLYAISVRNIFQSVYLQGLVCCLDIGTRALSDALLHPDFSSIPQSIASESLMAFEGATHIDEHLKEYLMTIPAWARRKVLEWLCNDTPTLVRRLCQQGLVAGIVADNRKAGMEERPVPPIILTKTLRVGCDVYGMLMPPEGDVPPPIALDKMIRKYCIEALLYYESYWELQLMVREGVYKEASNMDRGQLHSDINWLCPPTNWGCMIDMGTLTLPRKYRQVTPTPKMFISTCGKQSIDTIPKKEPTQANTKEEAKGSDDSLGNLEELV